MQAADFFAILPVPGAQVSGQGAGLFTGAGSGAAQDLGGLFGVAEGEGGEAAAETSAFAEALMAAMGVMQPQQPVEAAETPKGETADVLQAAPKAAPAGPYIPTLLSQPEAPAAADGAGVDAAAFAGLGEADVDLPADIGAKLAASTAPASPAAPAVPAAPVATAPAAKEPAAPAPLAGAPTASPAPDAVPADSNAKPAAQVANLPAPPTAPALTAKPAQAPHTPVTAAPAPAPSEGQAAPVTLPAAGQQAAVAAKPAAPEAQRGKAAEPAQTTPSSRTTDKAQAATPAAQPVAALTEAAVAAVDTAEGDEALHAEDAAPAPIHTAPSAEARNAVGAPVAEAPKATPHTVAQLSAQIIKGAEKSTRFEVQLDPIGLGKVDVKIEIMASGDIRADLSFESPLAAAELKARSGELQAALERAGFDPSKTQLSFNSGGQNSGGQFSQDLWRDQQQQNGQSNWRGAAFMDLGDAPQNPATSYLARERDGGVDVRI